MFEMQYLHANENIDYFAETQKYPIAQKCSLYAALLYERFSVLLF